MEGREIARERRVAVVVAVDVVGYSKLVERSEDSTIDRLTHYWEAEFRPRVERAGGRLIKLMGDGALAEFPSVGSALETTAAFGRQLISQEKDVDPDLRIRMRAGLHVGDVVVEAKDVYGHGVNIAARLEGIAAVDSICLSDTARSVLGRRAPRNLVDLGTRRFKNIEEPMRVWAYDFSGSPTPTAAPRISRRAGLAAILLVALTLLALWTGWLGTDHAGDPVVDRETGLASIIVLPFRNLSDDRRQDFFVDGMTEDLILDLARLDNLFVVSRNTAFAIAERNLSDRAIAEELGVRYVMQGSVRRQGDRIRVNVAIVDGADGTQLWGQRYDEQIRDVFEVQDRLKRQIVDALAVRLAEGEEEALTQRPTENVEAYEFYLRGRAARQQGTLRSFRLAYWAFEKAIELEPQFAPAIAALAELYATDFGGINHPMAWERLPTVSRIAAERLADKARKLAPKSALPDIALARLRIFERELGEALTYADRAVALEPQLAEAWVVKARAETAMGRHDQALKTISEAFRRDPEGTATQHAVRAMALFGLGDYPGASEATFAASKAAKVALNWQFYSIGIAATALAVREEGRENALRLEGFRKYLTGRDFAQSLDAFAISPIYSHPEDQARLLKGLEIAELFRVLPGSEAFPGPKIRDLFFGVESTGFCPATELNVTLRIAASGKALWSLRHDLHIAGDAEIVGQRLCMRFPVLSHFDDICFRVYENNPPAEYSLGYLYTMAGPLVCHMTPDAR